MDRNQALKTLADEIDRRAKIAISGKYCDAFGAGDTLEGHLKKHLPKYRQQFAKDFGVDDIMFQEMFGVK